MLPSSSKNICPSGPYSTSLIRFPIGKLSSSFESFASNFIRKKDSDRSPPIIAVPSYFGKSVSEYIIKPDGAIVGTQYTSGALNSGLVS